MDNNSQHSETLSEDLKGTTMKVYWLLLKEGKALSLREIQRRGALSTASLAIYHLNKLKRIGLVKSLPEGGYFISKEVRVGFLRFFVGRKGLLIPRYAFYFAFFAAELTGYLLISGFDYQPTSLVLIMTLIAGCLFSLFETVAMWKSSPIVN